MADLLHDFNFTDRSPYDQAAAVTTSDSAAVSPVPRAIYIGGAGNVKVDMASGGTVTFSAVPVGTVLKIRPTKIYATGTTATLMIALW